MNKKVVIAAGVALVVGGFVWYRMQQSSKKKDSRSKPKKDESETPTTGGAMTTGGSTTTGGSSFIEDVTPEGNPVTVNLGNPSGTFDDEVIYTPEIDGVSAIVPYSPPPPFINTGTTGTVTPAPQTIFVPQLPNIKGLSENQILSVITELQQFIFITSNLSQYRGERLDAQNWITSAQNYLQELQLANVRNQVEVENSSYSDPFINPSTTGTVRPTRNTAIVEQL